MGRVLNRAGYIGRNRLMPSRLTDRWPKTEPWRFPYSTREMIGLVAKGLEIPPDGWNAREFARQGRLLIVALSRMAKLTQRRAAPFVARQAVKVMDRQIEKVIQRATTGRKDRSIVEILLPQHEALWMQAITEVLAESNMDVQIELVPPIQSVMAQGYSRTSALLGQDPDADRHPALAREARNIAQKITRINDTTRQAMEQTVRRGIDAGQTVSEVAAALRREVGELTHRRSMTIARTELNNAWTHGTAQSLKESKSVTHVSVVGCEGREPNSPQYNGESTCNYPDLPMPELDAFLEVGFHPNHGGNLIPSRVRD